MKLSLENISKSYGENYVLKDISLRVENESVALMGKSGSGKTTLLRIAAGQRKAGEDNYGFFLHFRCSATALH